MARISLNLNQPKIKADSKAILLPVIHTVLTEARWNSSTGFLIFISRNIFNIKRN
jgi:hypothetical protein